MEVGGQASPEGMPALPPYPFLVALVFVIGSLVFGLEFPAVHASVDGRPDGIVKDIVQMRETSGDLCTQPLLRNWIILLRSRLEGLPCGAGL